MRSISGNIRPSSRRTWRRPSQHSAAWWRSAASSCSNGSDTRPARCAIKIELTGNVYFRNVNNNAGIFDYLIGAAEDQQSKEAFLAYYFLYAASQPPTAAELDARIGAWLQQTFGLKVRFAVGDALDKLERLGLLRRDGERLLVSPLDGALAQLRGLWAGFLAPQVAAAAK